MTLPAGWTSTTVGDVIRGIEAGKSEQTLERQPSGDDVGVVKVSAVTWGEFNPAEAKAISKERFDASKSICDGDLLFSRANTVELVGAVVHVRQDHPRLMLSDKILRLVVDDMVESRYLMFALRSPESRRHLEERATGTSTSMRNVTQDALRETPLLLPPLNEQRRIVAKLDSILEQTRATKARLERLPTLLQKLKRAILAAAFRGDLTADWRATHPNVEPASAFLDRIRAERRGRWEAALRAKGKDPSKAKYDDTSSIDPESEPLPRDWEWATIGRLCDVGTGATPKRGDPRFWENGTLPWVTSGATNSEYIDEASEFVTDRALAETNLTLFPAGTLLVAMYGEGRTRGRCAELRFAATTNQAVAGLVTTDLPVSLKEVIKFVLWDRYEVLRMEASGGVQPNLNLSIVRDIAVPIPPAAEQVELVDHVRQALTIIASAEARLSSARERVENLERAALAKAFRGELVAQDPTDEPAASLLQRLRAEAPANSAPIRGARAPDAARRPRSQTTSARRARAPNPTRSADRRS